MLEKLLLRIEVALTQSKALTGYTVRYMLIDKLAFKMNEAGKFDGRLIMLCLIFKQCFPKGCQELLHTPWPFTPTQRCFHLCSANMPTTHLNGTFLNYGMNMWKTRKPQVWLYCSSGVAPRIFYRKTCSFCLTYQVLCL